DPLEIRWRAASSEVSLYELGRALFHINQRRGFKSNRRLDRKEADGATKEGIEKLKASLEGKTLGAFLYDRQLSGHTVRFRPTTQGNKNLWDYYPNREMVEHELGAIWEMQKKRHPQLTDELRAKIERVIIQQRPLK